MTDPFMYKYPEIADMTLKIINKLNSNRIKCTILTKGIYPKDLTNTNKYSKENEYGITLVSLDSKFKEKFEPNSAPYLGRIKALKKLHDAGLKTWVSMEPYPTPNLVKQNLYDILKKISFVDNIIFGKLNYNCESTAFEKNNKLFYEIQARIVKEFCEKRGIKYHIKNGTKQINDKSTVKIFKNDSKQIPLVTFQVLRKPDLLVEA